MDNKNRIGLGVAGNFAHHLEQAGELKDFENVVTKEAEDKVVLHQVVM